VAINAHCHIGPTWAIASPLIFDFLLICFYRSLLTELLVTVTDVLTQTKNSKINFHNIRRVDWTVSNLLYILDKLL